MEKRIIIFGIFFVLIIFNLSNILGLGVSPPKVELNFKPYAKYSIGFQVLNVDDNQSVVLNISGDYSKYARLGERKITGPVGFYVYIDLPAEGGTPGKKYIAVHIKEDTGSGPGIGAVLQINPIIIIKVPYVGKYAKINSFKVSDTNEGESIYFNLKLENIGDQEIEPRVEFQIYMDGKLLDKYDVGRKVIAFDSFGLFEKTVSVNKYSAGNYEAKVVVRLNDINRTIITANTSLRVGSLNVDIINWTKEAVMGKINPYDIEVESLWNNKINSIYAEVNVTNSSGNSVDFFKTSPVTLNGWEKGKLNGFFNAEVLELGEYSSKIIIFYNDLNKTKIVPVNVVLPPEIPRQKIKLNFYMIIAIIIVIIVICFIVFIIFIRNKNEKKEINKKRK